MEFNTNLKKISNEHRLQNKITTVQENVAERKNGCLSLFIIILGVMFVSFTVIPVSILVMPDGNEYFTECIIMILVFVIIGVFIIYKGGKIGNSKNIANIDMSKKFKKLDKRYNDIDNNLKEINAQILDNDNTYVVSRYFYISKDWIIFFDDFAKIKDVVCAYTDSYEVRDNNTKIRTKYERINFLLNNAEIVGTLLDYDIAVQAIDLLKQKNPNMFTTETIRTSDGQKLSAIKHKSQVIDEYNKTVRPL